jgi:hypothetical protein
MATSTPVPYWLSLPLAELCEWAATVERVQIDDAKGSG